jgi:hypothetical protein
MTTGAYLRTHGTAVLPHASATGGARRAGRLLRPAHLRERALDRVDDGRVERVHRRVEEPDDVAAVQNERFMNVCDGTSQNQWSNTPKSRARPKFRQMLLAWPTCR